MSYPDRVCPECGLSFTPTTKRQVYHSAYCRVKANRKLHRGDEQPIDRSGLLDEIRRSDPETAKDIEDIAKRAGLAFAEEILLVCYRAMNRAALRHAKAVLIESGEVRPVKAKQRKAAKP
jgi:alkylhydroperoxidase family enzyme